MRFAIRSLTPADVGAILEWRYPSPYDVYDMDADPEDVVELRAAAQGRGHWYAVDDEDAGELVAFLDFTPAADEIELGLGLRPDHMGRGLGAALVADALAFATATWGDPRRFVLDVLPWNERAIRAYEKAGFVRGEVHLRRFESGIEREFLRMARPGSSGPGRLHGVEERAFSSALVLFAHPDDAEFMCGGTVASWSAAGCDVHYVVITDGSAGSNEPGAVRAETAVVREREQRDAAAILGVRSVTFLGEPDGMLEVTLDTRRKVCREVRRLRPEVLVAPDPARLWSAGGAINHWDHKQAGLLALTAVMPDAPSRPMFPELLDEGLEPFEVPNLYLVSEQADVFVDITPFMDTKLAALAAHTSQGTESAIPWVVERAETLARQSGRSIRSAEAFKAFRFVDEEEGET